MKLPKIINWPLLAVIIAFVFLFIWLRYTHA